MCAVSAAFSLLVTLQVVPPGENQPTVAVDDRGEGAARGVVEDRNGAGGGSQAVDAGDGRRAFVFVQLRIQVRLAAARAIGREENAVVACVQWRHVVVAGGLVGHPGDHRSLACSQARHLIHLPGAGGGDVAAGRAADQHAEDGLAPVPVHAGLAHGDGLDALESFHAESGFLGQVAQGAAGIADHQVPAARDIAHSWQVVGESGRAAGEHIARRRDLGHEQDRVLDRSSNSAGLRHGRSGRRDRSRHRRCFRSRDDLVVAGGKHRGHGHERCTKREAGECCAGARHVDHSGMRTGKRYRVSGTGSDRTRDEWIPRRGW